MTYPKTYLVYGVCLEKDTYLWRPELSIKDPLSPENLLHYNKSHDNFSIVVLGSFDLSRFVVAYGEVFENSWGTSDILSIASLKTPPESDDKIKAYVEKYELNIDGDIGWKLGIYWNSGLGLKL